VSCTAFIHVAAAVTSEGKSLAFRLFLPGATNGVAVRLAEVVVVKRWLPGVKGGQETPLERLCALGNE
jgi:hypothetical protein